MTSHSVNYQNWWIIKAIIPASGFDSEKAFSCLRRMKTYLRNSKALERSSELILQTLEK
jgi:hypothetical protein